MNIQPLKVKETPLDERVLIEASAGTGKTYTIGLIVIRLLLEKLLPIQKIVLITFTEAATADLKKKTAEKIMEALDRWKKDDNNDDLTAIIEGAKKSEDALIKEANLLDAIARIDEMPVFTIHGFCTRLLNEFTYETENFEEKDIIKNQSDIENKIIADFWRTEMRKLSKEEIEMLPEKFSPETLKIGIGKVINFPQAKKSYRDECASEDNAENNFVAKLQYKLADNLSNALQEEKKRMKVRGFGDLIKDVYDAVVRDNAGSKTLFNAVQKKYDAILVDEFQDTDKMQFKIFSDLFEGKPFFMIGDPKQAIYRFRGGDIHAYLEAKDKTEEKNIYTLKKNFRSQKRLLAALNEIFTSVEDPFETGKDKIKYESVEPGKNGFPPELLINGKAPLKPLVVRNFEYKNKEVALKQIKEEIVREIIRLLYKTETEIYDKDTGEFRRIGPRDIAILTRKNDEARKYRNALKDVSIPAVIRRSDSVFKSDAADYIMRLLRAFINSQRESCVKAALMETREITSENLKAEEIKPFANAFDIWKKNGVMLAINSYFDSTGLWRKMRWVKNGERNVTNLRQLIGILNEEESASGRVPERTLRRFAELIQGCDAEEHEEKLETDDDAVQIMTIHTSKGLEFPIVFVPDITVPGEAKNKKPYECEPPIYYGKEGKNAGEIIIVYEISNRKANAKEEEYKEHIQESARNFYVAVTRSIYRLYIVNAHKKAAESAGQKICAKIKEDENIQKIDNSLTEIEYSSNSNAKLITAIKESSKKEPKPLPSKIEIAWRKTSFTGIVRKLQKHGYNEDLPKEKPLVPKGSKTGNLLHSIFENLDFGADSKTISAEVENMLKGFREFTEEGKALIKKWVEWIFNKDLGFAGKLKEIDSGKRVAELEFLMSSKAGKIYLEKIKKIIDIPDILDGEKELPNKYLDGKIDLIFLGKDDKYYILDWKSNYLSDYSEKAMNEEAMRPNGYHLQYYIYAVALKRWLNKIHGEGYFEENFGGVYYIFIRGICEDEKNSEGIYFAPGKKIINSIDKLDDILKEKENGKP